MLAFPDLISYPHSRPEMTDKKISPCNMMSWALLVTKSKSRRIGKIGISHISIWVKLFGIIKDRLDHIDAHLFYDNDGARRDSVAYMLVVVGYHVSITNWRDGSRRTSEMKELIYGRLYTEEILKTIYSLLPTKFQRKECDSGLG